jgi:hypothetical protein
MSVCQIKRYGTTVVEVNDTASVPTILRCNSCWRTNKSKDTRIMRTSHEKYHCILLKNPLNQAMIISTVALSYLLSLTGFVTPLLAQQQNQTNVTVTASNTTRQQQNQTEADGGRCWEN